jgi:hypothetical protein
MSNYGGDKRGSHLPSWGRAIALVVGAAMVLAVLYYKAHPQLLQKQIGTLGIALVGAAAGGYLIFSAITGVRSGVSAANFIGGQYQRAANAPRFWFVVIFDFAFGVFMLVAGLRLLFGLFNS